MYWFTSDQHFNHANILTKFVFRPFRCVEEMNATIIQRHNERVKSGHTVYYLGDFKVSSQGPNVHELVSQLNGNHVFIRGNHDKNNGLNVPLRYCVIESFGRTIVLAHREEDAREVMRMTGIGFAFVGHSHDVWKFKPDMVNVGVDQWGFYPVDIKQIFKAHKKWMWEGE